ncbi:hypothetical protein GGX14DRAFT_551797 [Mycena pura]|uniref:Uncharacterized protein n=1 Tax=Mycena pura TaxID=153505 RepID=A0AAD6YB41_9AGAR|nr:hypothetical protein GGX14DRAFT_551797 [Mycena pura]
MSESQSSPPAPTSRGSARGKSRGGLGKYLRARGRGRGAGRPAEFTTRLVLEDETVIADDDPAAAEIAAENARKFSRRQLGTNVDRYVEPEPELDSDGEPVIEPEVDLSDFLSRQRIDDTPNLSMNASDPVNEDDVDVSLAHISSSGAKLASTRKGKVQKIEWDSELDELEREKASAEAIWGTVPLAYLKTRFRAKSEKLRIPTTTVGRERRPGSDPVEAPPLPLPDGSLPPPKAPREEMQDFLDDLLG